MDEFKSRLKVVGKSIGGITLMIMSVAAFYVVIFTPYFLIAVFLPEYVANTILCILFGSITLLLLAYSAKKLIDFAKWLFVEPFTKKKQD